MAGNIQNVYTDEEQDISERNQLVSDLEEIEGIQEPSVLQALRSVPRHWFVPADLRVDAYRNHPLPIGFGQTISQPYMVARAAELLRLSGDERVLEIGGGSGYQAAVLSFLAREVFAIEQDARLVERAVPAARAAGCERLSFQTGDGKLGWPSKAPFDRILVSCAARDAEPAWLEQLRPGGLLVFPLQDGQSQWMERWRRGETGWDFRQKILPVKFVPLL
jgi:protein-L-isoaspartate(D-aspartate) O-methyltransferase